MAPSFPSVAEVSVDDPVSSRNLAQLAGAINVRLLSGLGDIAWRVAWYWFQAFRQIRNPNADDTLYPAQHEFFTSYQGLGPEWTWPDAAPGEPEGINVSSLVGAYVFGNQTGQIDNEADRLVANAVQVSSADDPQSAWDLGKQQRGAYDPATQGMACPAFNAAISYGVLTQDSFSPHGNSYGGFHPIPEGAGVVCGDGSESLMYKFTNLQTAAVITYPGSCIGTPGDVTAIYRMPDAFYIIIDSGATQYLPRNQWIEGPYTRGEHPAHTWGDHIPRTMAKFSAEFRGTPDQRDAEVAGQSGWLDAAFDTGTFLASPYYLAPQRGVEISKGVVVPDYSSANVPSGVTNIGNLIGKAIKTADGFGVTMVFLSAVGLLDPLTVEIANDGKAIGTLSVTPDAPAGILTLREAVHGTNITATATSSARHGGLELEWGETLDYRPTLADLFVVIRLSGAKTPGEKTTDGSGITEEGAAEMWQGYVSGGCIRSQGSHRELEGSDFIGNNGLYDAMRRASKCVRMVPRDNFLGYAVEGGNSILWVSPRAFGVPKTANADLLNGITDAIKEIADPGGYTNEWCAFVNPQPYNPMESSNYKASVFTDYNPMMDRCLFFSGFGVGDLEFKRFLTNNNSADLNLTILPEGSNGHRYEKNINNNAVGRPGFYKSCRIYEPPLSIKSAEKQTDGSVKITFNGRFHSHPSAPASIARDLGTWVIADLTAEAADYRTIENAIREYIWHSNVLGGYQCDRTGEGNSNSSHNIDFEPDRPFGACYPTLFLVQMIPKPFVDGNDDQDETDTPFESFPLRMAEEYLRVGCEGFVDKQTTETSGCVAGNTFDFKFDQLCYQATGMPWLLAVAKTASEYLLENEVRPDMPQGFGPMPTVKASAEVFNGFARAVNKLTRVRVSLPWDFMTRTATSSPNVTAMQGVMNADGTAGNCATFSTGGLLWTGTQPDASTPAFSGAWSVAGSASSYVDSQWNVSGSAFACSGTSFQMTTTRQDEEYKFDLTDPDALQAIPEPWRSMLATNAEVIVSEVTTIRRITYTVDPVTGTDCAGTAAWEVSPGNHLLFATNQDLQTLCKPAGTGGTCHAPTAGVITIYGAFEGVTLCDSGYYSPNASGRVDRTISPVDTTTMILSVPLDDPDPTT